MLLSLILEVHHPWFYILKPDGGSHLARLFSEIWNLIEKGVSFGSYQLVCLLIDGRHCQHWSRCKKLVCLLIDGSIILLVNLIMWVSSSNKIVHFGAVLGAH